MIHIARTWRVFAGGMAAGFVGVVLVAGGKASAEPLFPQPPLPAPVQQAAPPVQNLTAVPGGVSNRFAPAPAQASAPAPVVSPLPPAAVTPMPPAVAPMPPAVTPAATGTLWEFLQGKGVKFEPQRSQGFKALDITLPMPPRWTAVPDPNVPDAFLVIADRVGGNSIYTSNAQVVVYKLVGDFDPAEAMTHGFVDSQKLLAWRTTNSSMADFNGFPSSIIEGTYRENDMTLNTSRRHVLATSGADKYLVSLSVTTAASQAIADAPATDAIVNGFRVTLPTAADQLPARAGAPAAPQLPAQSPAPVTRSAPAGIPAPATAPSLNPATQALPGVSPALPPLVTLTPAPSH
ncbi:LpqN/LpqT family lipoprotein [Mycobacterium pseudokansasii]|uniref:LpqN/LpqT family lipoprotein n=1 Tax=Mycobacterium pseudokansasii TaxID=2341080 RepID=UPI000C0793F3|nr:LpqN/LpqT family lipoprotein [Mycobacterium pseudokansasii]VAZ87378.1 Proline-rich 28 kDa antigen [Mycobacterium pseudokansasii]